MKNRFRSVMATAMVAVMLVMSGCNMFSSKENTKSANDVLASAKIELATSFATAMKANFDSYATQTLAALQAPSGEKTGEFKFKLDSNNGNADITVSVEGKEDNSKLAELKADATLMDVFMAVAGEGTIKIAFEAGMPPFTPTMKGSATFNTAMKDGVFYGKLSEYELPENLPEDGDTEQMKQALELAKGKWYMVDFKKLTESEAIIAALMSTKLINMDTAKAGKLAQIYADEVIKTVNWVTLDEESKQETSEGDSYTVNITKANVKSIVAAHLDFMINNLEDIDDVLDISGKNNPVLKAQGVEPMPLDGIKAELEAAKADIDSIDQENIPNIPLTVVIASDAVQKVSYNYSQEEFGSKYTADVHWNFENNEHNFKHTHLTGKLTMDAMMEDKASNVVTVTGAIGKPEGTNRAMEIDVMADPSAIGENIVIKANAKMSLAESNNQLKALDMNLDMSMPDNNGTTEPKAIKGSLSYANNGADHSLEGEIETDPSSMMKGEIEGNFSQTEGDMSGNMKINVDGMEADVNTSLKYELDEKTPTITLPATAEVMDVTDFIIEGAQQFANGFNQGFNAGYQDTNASADFDAADYEMTPEEMAEFQSVLDSLNESGAVAVDPNFQ